MMLGYSNHMHTLLEAVSLSQESESVSPAMHQDPPKWKLNKLHSSVQKQRLTLWQHYVFYREILDMEKIIFQNKVI